MEQDFKISEAEFEEWAKKNNLLLTSIYHNPRILSSFSMRFLNPFGNEIVAYFRDNKFDCVRKGGNF